MKSIDELIEYLLNGKETFEYLRADSEPNSYYIGYYQGKLDLTDYTLRFIADDPDKSFGGFINEEAEKNAVKRTD